MRVTRLTDLRLENSNQRIIMCPRCTQTTNQRCVLHNISFRHNITEMVLHRGCEEEMKNNNKDVPHRTALTYELLCPSFRPRPGTDAELQMSTNSTNNAWHPNSIGPLLGDTLNLLYLCVTLQPNIVTGPALTRHSIPTHRRTAADPPRCRRKSAKSFEEWLSSSVKDADKLGPIQIGTLDFTWTRK